MGYTEVRVGDGNEDGRGGADRMGELNTVKQGGDIVQVKEATMESKTSNDDGKRYEGDRK